MDQFYFERHDAMLFFIAEAERAMEEREEDRYDLLEEAISRLHKVPNGDLVTPGVLFNAYIDHVMRG